jgi:hypothetical protein
MKPRDRTVFGTANLGPVDVSDVEALIRARSTGVRSGAST